MHRFPAWLRLNPSLRENTGRPSVDAVREMLAIGAALVCVLGLPDLMRSNAAWLSALLVVPSSHVAAVLMGVPLVVVEDGGLFMLPAYGKPLEVTAACSGVGFFSLLVALVTWHAFRGRKLQLFALIPLAFPLTLGVNGCRIAAVSWGNALSDRIFGPVYHDMAHLILGSVVFLPALYFAHILLIHASRRLEPKKHNDD
jgi:exosortase/archaeosortase family protein